MKQKLAPQKCMFLREKYFIFRKFNFKAKKIRPESYSFLAFVGLFEL